MVSLDFRPERAPGGSRTPPDPTKKLQDAPGTAHDAPNMHPRGPQLGRPLPGCKKLNFLLDKNVLGLKINPILIVVDETLWNESSRSGQKDGMG